jgi:hypothetical protein
MYYRRVVSSLAAYDRTVIASPLWHSPPFPAIAQASGNIEIVSRKGNRFGQ